MWAGVPDLGQFALNPKTRFRAVGDEGVIIQIDQGQVVVVNGTGLRALNLIKQGFDDSEALSETIAMEYEEDQTQVAADVLHYLQQLSDAGILLDVSEP